jgi:hypothetical protein
MDRIYSQGKTDNAKYFVANEVEQTPAYGMRTLFMVGLQPVEEIVELARKHNCYNVYFGTGTTFLPTSHEEVAKWNDVIEQVIQHDLWATLDFDSNLAHYVHSMPVSQNRRFIPMISVKLPYANQLNYNATLKIDDKDFNLTNPGVWCHSLHELTRRDTFTDWSKYSKDQCINKEQR